MGEAMALLETESPAVAACEAQVRYPRPDGEDTYVISEVAAHTGLSAHTLRWYERIGLMPHVDRSHTGQRRYTNRDLHWLDFVGKLRLTGMPVADMVRYAELMREGDHTIPERRALLEAHREAVRERMEELRDSLRVLDRKIHNYACAPGHAEEGLATR
jgi:DNA-binding transcriptional MerR regulator